MAVLLYGAETWKLTTPSTNKNEAFEMGTHSKFSGHPYNEHCSLTSFRQEDRITSYSKDPENSILRKHTKEKKYYFHQLRGKIGENFGVGINNPFCLWNITH